MLMTAGRTPREIDWKRVDELLEAGCLGTEVASHFGLSGDRFYDRVREKFGINFTQYASEKRQKGDSCLRERQYKKALTGDNMMLIWLGKNRLGQSDHQEKEKAPNDTAIDNQHLVLKLTHENNILKKKLDELLSQTNRELQPSQ